MEEGYRSATETTPTTTPGNPANSSSIEGLPPDRSTVVPLAEELTDESVAEVLVDDSDAPVDLVDADIAGDGAEMAAGTE